MKQKYWFLLTMLPLVALLGYWTNLTWWQAVLVGGLLNMWAWTLLSPHLTTDAKKACGADTAQRARHSGCSRAVRWNTTGIVVDEDIQNTWHSLGAFDSNSSAIQANPANGLPMLNSVYDVHGNVFGTTWADDQWRHD